MQRNRFMAVLFLSLIFFSSTILSDEQGQADDTALRCSLSQNGWITNWFIDGPYELFTDEEDNAENYWAQVEKSPAGFNEKNMMEHIDATHWHFFVNKEPLLDLDRLFGARENIVVYVAFCLEVKNNLEATFKLGSDDGFHFYLNNKLLKKHIKERAARPDDDTISATLKAGLNRIVVKVHQRYRGYGLFLRVVGPSGESINDKVQLVFPGAVWPVEDDPEFVRKTSAVQYNSQNNTYEVTNLCYPISQKEHADKIVGLLESYADYIIKSGLASKERIFALTSRGYPQGSLLNIIDKNRGVDFRMFDDGFAVQATALGDVYDGGFIACDNTIQQFKLIVPTIESNKKYPLLVHLHGGGGTADDLLDCQYDAVKQNGFFAVTPHRKGGGYRGEGEKDILQLMDLLIKHYPIDVDRIYMSGHSMGAWGTFTVGLRYTDRFAALAPLNGGGNLSLACNARCIPVYLGVGGKDEWALRSMSKFRDYFQENHYEHLYYVAPGVEHVYSKDTFPIVDWCKAYSRKPHPERITWKSFEPATGKCYWIRIDRNELWGLGAYVDARFESKKRIEISTENVEEFAVLADEVLFSNKKIDIEVDGSIVYHGPIPSGKEIHIDKHGDEAKWQAELRKAGKVANDHIIGGLDKELSKDEFMQAMARRIAKATGAQLIALSTVSDENFDRYKNPDLGISGVMALTSEENIGICQLIAEKTIDFLQEAIDNNWFQLFDCRNDRAILNKKAKMKGIVAGPQWIVRYLETIEGKIIPNTKNITFARIIVEMVNEANTAN